MASQSALKNLGAPLHMNSVNEDISSKHCGEPIVLCYPTASGEASPADKWVSVISFSDSNIAIVEVLRSRYL
jgi:hypothetical protein